MAAKGSLLADVKRAVVTWGGTLRRSYGDRHGDFAVRFTFRGETFIGVAKREPVHGLASFMQEVAHKADRRDAYLVEFFGSDPGLGDAYVFDPSTVISEGQTSHGTSKKEVPTEWYELPLEKGVLLGDFVSGRAEPEGPPSEEAGSVTLTDYA